MSSDIRMDSHKLIFHPDRVARWRRGENIYPIELEVGLTNSCNHRCVFCAVDYTGYQPVRLDKDVLLKNLKLLAPRGLKSIVYAGEGEPLLHKDAPDIVNETKRLGIDAAMSTNGVLFTPQVARDCLGSLTWIRFSVGGIREETYNKIQRGRDGDLKRVLDNLQAAVEEKKRNGWDSTIGVQLLLLPDNKDELTLMARKLREIGVDYFTIKPFSQHPMSENILQVDYSEMLACERELKEIQTDSFRIYFRAHSLKKLQEKRGYKHCYALPFMVYVDALGNLWPCIAFMGREELSYGNLYQGDFTHIWESAHKKKVDDYFARMDLEKYCRELCRLDEMNRYLDELVHPGGHVNFI